MNNGLLTLVGFENDSEWIAVVLFFIARGLVGGALELVWLGMGLASPWFTELVSARQYSRVRFFGSTVTMILAQFQHQIQVPICTLPNHIHLKQSEWIRPKDNGGCIFMFLSSSVRSSSCLHTL